SWCRPKADSRGICRRTLRCRSSMRRKNMARTKHHWSFWRVKSMARDRRATGPPKGPRCPAGARASPETYERIHRSNLVGMGILPLQFPAALNAESLNLTGEEVFDITGIRDVVEHFAAGRTVKVKAKAKGQDPIEFEALVRIDTPQEALYYANGGILQYVLRQLLATKAEPVGA